MIKQKLKNCSGCNTQQYLFSQGLCRSCWAKQYQKPINKQSDKEKKRLEKYRILRDQYLKEHPVCEFPGCSSQEVECHHAEGRAGDSLFGEFRALCRKHHQYVEANPEEARALNLSKTRL